MKYYRVIVNNSNNGDEPETVYFENKTEIGNKKIIATLIERGEISPFDVNSLKIKEITEEEYEENSF